MEKGSFDSFPRSCVGMHILEQLSFYKKARKTDRAYQFWQEGIHPEWIQNKEMMRQKIEYVHRNPVKRGYVDHPEH